MRRFTNSESFCFLFLPIIDLGFLVYLFFNGVKVGGKRIGGRETNRVRGTKKISGKQWWVVLFFYFLEVTYIIIFISLG